MSSNFDQNIRPEPDELIVKIADYVDSYEINSDLAMDTACYCGATLEYTKKNREGWMVGAAFDAFYGN